jgi:glycosyltransferase involved in cell wall biosynthesis
VPDHPIHRNVVHAGWVYGDRSLVPVLLALQQLSSRPGYADVRLDVYGEVSQPERQRVEAAGVARFLVIHSRVPKEQLAYILASAGALLAVSGDQMQYSVPYKVYDYLAAGRPLLGLASKGTEMHRFIGGNGFGAVHEPQDVEGIAATIERCFNGELQPASPDAVASFSWSAHADRYREIFQRLHAARPGAPT